MLLKRSINLYSAHLEFRILGLINTLTCSHFTSNSTHSMACLINVHRISIHQALC